MLCHFRQDTKSNCTLSIKPEKLPELWRELKQAVDEYCPSPTACFFPPSSKKVAAKKALLSFLQELIEPSEKNAKLSLSDKDCNAMKTGNLKKALAEVLQKYNTPTDKAKKRQLVESCISIMRSKLASQNSQHISVMVTDTGDNALMAAWHSGQASRTSSSSSWEFTP